MVGKRTIPTFCACCGTSFKITIGGGGRRKEFCSPECKNLTHLLHRADTHLGLVLARVLHGCNDGTVDALEVARARLKRAEAAQRRTAKALDAATRGLDAAKASQHVECAKGAVTKRQAQHMAGIKALLWSMANATNVVGKQVKTPK